MYPVSIVSHSVNVMLWLFVCMKWVQASWLGWNRGLSWHRDVSLSWSPLEQSLHTNEEQTFNRVWLSLCMWIHMCVCLWGLNKGGDEAKITSSGLCKLYLKAESPREHRTMCHVSNQQMFARRFVRFKIRVQLLNQTTPNAMSCWTFDRFEWFQELMFLSGFFFYFSLSFWAALRLNLEHSKHSLLGIRQCCHVKCILLLNHFSPSLQNRTVT